MRFIKGINELTFVILPFIAIGIIRLLQNDLTSLLYISDPAIATCIVFGQLSFKFESIKSYSGERVDNYLFFTNMLKFLASIALILYVSLMTVENVSIIIHIIKYLFFLASLFLYVIWSQLASDLEVEVNKR